MKSIVVLTLVGLAALANCKPGEQVKLDDQKGTVNVKDTTATHWFSPKENWKKLMELKPIQTVAQFVKQKINPYIDCKNMIGDQVEKKSKHKHDYKPVTVPPVVTSIAGGPQQGCCKGCKQNLDLFQCEACGKYVHSTKSSKCGNQQETNKPQIPEVVELNSSKQPEPMASPDSSSNCGNKQENHKPQIPQVVELNSSTQPEPPEVPGSPTVTKGTTAGGDGLNGIDLSKITPSFADPIPLSKIVLKNEELEEAAVRFYKRDPDEIRTMLTNTFQTITSAVRKSVAAKAFRGTGDREIYQPFLYNMLTKGAVVQYEDVDQFSLTWKDGEKVHNETVDLNNYSAALKLLLRVGSNWEGDEGSAFFTDAFRSAVCKNVKKENWGELSEQILYFDNLREKNTERLIYIIEEALALLATDSYKGVTSNGLGATLGAALFRQNDSLLITYADHIQIIFTPICTEAGVAELRKHLDKLKSDRESSPGVDDSDSDSRPSISPISDSYSDP